LEKETRYKVGIRVLEVDSCYDYIISISIINTDYL